MTNSNKLADALSARDAAIQQAQIWKQEAQTANATIAEIYRLVGSKAGNWNGAKPVREALAEHAASLAAPPAQGEWVMVPREPTEAMIEAAEIREDAEPLSDWGKIVCAPHEAIYAAMLAAAPQPTQVEQFPAGDIGVGDHAQTTEYVRDNPQPAPAPVQVDGWCPKCGCGGSGYAHLAGCVNLHPPAPAADGAGELPPLPELPQIVDGQAIKDYAIAYARTYTSAAIAALRQPVPDAVRELPGKWRIRASKYDDDFDGVSDADLERGSAIADAIRNAARDLEVIIAALASQQESRK